MPVIKIHSPGGSHLAAAVMGAMAAGLAEPLADSRTKRPRSKAERTRRRNPSGLVCNQHVFPVRSIARFAGPDGRVAVQDLDRAKARRAKPQDTLLYARRAWDQRAETGYMKAIEDDFQTLADAIIDGNATVSTPEQKVVVERMFALWYMRARYRELGPQAIKLNGVAGDALTPEQEETLEKKGYLFARSGGLMPARQLNGLWLQRRIHGYAQALGAIERWGVVTPQAGEFLVTDVPLHTILPLTPTLALAASSKDGTILRDNLAELNRVMMAGSERSYFARDLTACPIAPE